MRFVSCVRLIADVQGSQTGPVNYTQNRLVDVLFFPFVFFCLTFVPEEEVHFMNSEPTWTKFTYLYIQVNTWSLFKLFGVADEVLLVPHLFYTSLPVRNYKSGEKIFTISTCHSTGLISEEFSFLSVVVSHKTHSSNRLKTLCNVMCVRTSSTCLICWKIYPIPCK